MADRDTHMTRDELWAAMRRDSEGMRQLRQYLDGIKDLDDSAFAEATGDTDRGEAMALLHNLDALLGDVDQLTAQLHPDVN